MQRFLDEQLNGVLDDWGNLWNSRSFKRERRALQGLSRRDFELREFQELGDRLRTISTQTGNDFGDLETGIDVDFLPQRVLRRNSM